MPKKRSRREAHIPESVEGRLSIRSTTVAWQNLQADIQGLFSELTDRTEELLTALDAKVKLARARNAAYMRDRRKFDREFRERERERSNELRRQKRAALSPEEREALNAENREYMREYMKEYRRKNREKLRERTRECMRRKRAADKAKLGVQLQ